MSRALRWGQHGIGGQSHDVSHLMPVAPAEHAPAAEAAIAPEDDLRLRPDLPEAFDQQGQNRPGMGGRIDVGRGAGKR